MKQYYYAGLFWASALLGCSVKEKPLPPATASERPSLKAGEETVPSEEVLKKEANTPLQEQPLKEQPKVPTGFAIEEAEIKRIEDGVHTATVYFSDSVTGYSNTYTLEVEVHDEYVTAIRFPNDGFLNNDQISTGWFDEHGIAHIKGENGKTYKVRLNL